MIDQLLYGLNLNILSQSSFIEALFNKLPDYDVTVQQANPSQADFALELK